eukprot:4966647-Lingulodinium_polyedra.AAC.1
MALAVRPAPARAGAPLWRLAAASRLRPAPAGREAAGGAAPLRRALRDDRPRSPAAAWGLRRLAPRLGLASAGGP